MAEYTKTPEAVLDYEVNWATWLGVDTIASSSWEIVGDDGTLVIDDDTVFTTTVATVWLSGGSLDREYRVKNTIVTAASRTDSRIIQIQMAEKE